MWSIIYQSWLTFVFLLVANLLWVKPNKGHTVRRINLFVVFYADFLLIMQYYYSMNLTKDEMPQNTNKKRIDLTQIGFVNYKVYPSVSLLLKTMFTLTFCFTLRQQYIKIRPNWKMAHLTFSRQTSNADDVDNDAISIATNILRKSFDLIVSVLLRLWVWFVLIAIFFFAISGEHMTIFKIVYMTLFLVFLVSYQVSCSQVNFLN